MSSGFGNFMKNGWHPEKEGTTLKGQVNGLLGRNKDKERENHVARPLSSLQDPSSFAPPPRRVPGQPLPPPPRSNATSPGVPPPPYDASNGYAQQQPEEEATPPQPFRVNTTGLSTAHLPPPPGRKDGADGRTPVPDQAAVRPPPPNLPPRLPPRTPSTTSTATSPSPPVPPPTASGVGYLNQSAMNRLGAAGISVPSLGIGKSAPEPVARSNAGSPAPPPRTGALSPPSAGQMSELQNRFSKLGKPSGQSPSPPPTEGTTMEQKQAALRTASNFHKDPSSVSLKDARSAASTFNNFRQRHGDQVAAGVKSANNLNQKYGIADKVGKYAGHASGQVGEQQQAGTTNPPSNLSSPSSGLANALGKKKPPPPPPPKKKSQLGGPAPGADDDDVPPPIPLATKPTF